MSPSNGAALLAIIAEFDEIQFGLKVQMINQEELGKERKERKERTI